jgi:protease-4
MSTRGGKIEDVDTVARGRIFLADHAKRLGMVDELGGLDDALADAARQGGLGEDFDVVLLPDETPDPFAGGGLPLPIGQAPIMDLLGLFPAHARQAVLHAVATSELLADRPVVAITPITIRIR